MAWIVFGALTVVFVLVITFSLCHISAKADGEAHEPWVKYPVPLDDDLQKHIARLCREHGISPEIVLAIIGTESRYSADVIGDNGNSYGLMQINQRWHTDRMARLGVDNLLNPYQNVKVGIDFLAELMDRYDLDGALQYYNSGSPDGAPEYAYKVIRLSECILEGAMIQ